MSTFIERGAVTAPGSRVNEDAYGTWPQPVSAFAAWVLDGVTGINDQPLLPGPSDAAWLVAQVQTILPSLLSTAPEKDVRSLLRELVAELGRAQSRSWRDGMDERHGEVPAASFSLAWWIGSDIEIARLGDCPVLIERHDGTIVVLDDPVLTAMEAELKARILELRARGIADAAAIYREMMPLLRKFRLRCNRPDGYGVLSADPACLEFLHIDRLPGQDIRRLLLLSDGYYRLVDIYGNNSDQSLMHETVAHGPDEMLNRLRAIEAGDPTGNRHPRLKLADDATALLLELD
ncbi:MAG: protein phosphatase 2C domain-containing protein [Proteobacteria bacterium]|nr:protein phosphatase 2C domain-containing protein [Pseudomonadota bacterium]